MTRSSKQLLDRLRKARGRLRAPAGEEPKSAASLAGAKSAEALFEKASSGARPAPSSILFVRSDSYGDLVLFAPVLAGLKRQWPDTRIGLLLKERHQDVIPLLPKGVEYLVTEADPYRGKASEFARAADLADAIGAFAPEVLVAPSYEKSWLHALAAAAVPSSRRVSVGPAVFDSSTVDHFAQKGLGDCSVLYPEVVSVDRESHELDKGAHLIRHLCDCELSPLMPTIQVPAKAASEAKAVLGRLGLKPGRFVVCNPAGGANVSLKSWSPEHFAEVVAWLGDQSGLRVLLVAHSSEEATVQAVAGHTPSGRKAPAIWLGSHGELPLLAGLLASARAYVGNDTSTLHLAEAVQVPVLGVFGGGTWPRFSPSLPHSIAVVHPLPCFGCGWDCHLVDAPCVKLVRPADVIAQLPRLLAPAGRALEGDRIVRLSRVDEDQLATFRRSRQRAIETERDRQARLAQVLVLTRELAAREAIIADLHRRHADVTKRTETSSAETIALRQQLDHLSEKLRATEVDSGNRLQQIKVLTAAVNTARDECTALRQQVESAGGAQQVERRLLEEQKRQVAETLASAKSVQEANAAQMDGLRRENDGLRTQVADFTLKIRLLEEEVRNLRIEQGVLSSRSAQLEPLVESLRRESLDTADSHRQALWKKDQELRAAIADRDHLRIEVGELQSKLDDLSRQLAQARSEFAGQSATLTEAVARAKQQLEGLAAERTKLQSQLGELSAAVQQRTAENRDLAARLTAVTAERDAAAGALRQKTDEAAKAAESGARAQTQRAHLEAVLARHAQELEGCRKEIARLHGLLSQATDTHEQDLFAVRQRDLSLTKLQSEIAAAEQARSAEAQARQSAETQRDALQGSLASASLDRDVAHQARVAADQRCESLESSLAAANDQVVQRDVVIAELNERLPRERDEAAAKYERLLARVRQLEEALGGRDHQLELKARENNRLADRLSDTTNALENALAGLGERNNAVALLEASLAGTLARLANTESRLGGLEQTHALTCDEQRRTLAELNDVTQLVADLREAAAEQVSAMRRLEEQRLNEVAEHRQVQAGLNRELAALGSNLAARTAEAADLAGRLQAVQTVLAERRREFESEIAAVRGQADRERSALQATLAALQATLAEERTITRAHRRSAMRLTERLQELAQCDPEKLS